MRFSKYVSIGMALIVAMTLLACGGLSSPVATRPTNTPQSSAGRQATATPEPTLESTSTPKPISTPEVSPATGERSFARGAIKQRPYIVMIDNHPDAYPQSGLDQASIVFEALAEGGTTRFMAVYQEGITPEVGEIGPVRSTRIYFAQWAMGFQPIYVHVGGSPDGLALVQTSNRIMNLDLDDLANNRSYGRRDNRRVAPHNFYTSTKQIRSFTKDHRFSAFTHKDPKIGYLFDTIAPAAPPEVATIAYSFRFDNAEWSYDPESKRYYRTMNDQPHVDRVTDEQLWTRNLVVMEVQERDRPGDEKLRIDLDVTGSGRANIFLSGRQVKATWRKEKAEAPLRFYDAAGKEIVFNVGPIWITVVTSLDEVSAQ